MISAIRLGLRLAGLSASVSGGAARVRTLMVALTSLIGTFLLLVVGSITRSEILQRPAGLERGVKILLLAVVIAVSMPVLSLAATSGRLSAAMRDRRLANLRLLGLSARRTRVVAAVETGAAAVFGAVIGCGVFLLARPVIAGLHPAGREWPLHTLWPYWWATMLAVVTVPLAVGAVSVLPQRSTSRAALLQARRATTRRPSPLRLLPLAAGVALATFVISQAENRLAQDSGSNERLSPYMLAAIALLGIGTLLAVPVFVRLIGDVLASRSGRPTLLIAGRRLQEQPAAMTRVVAGLLIGLFVVTGARAVVVAFEDTQQYRASAIGETTGQVATVYTPARLAPAVRERLDADPDVVQTAAFPRLRASCHVADFCGTAAVASCSDFERFYPGVKGCRAGEPMWVGTDGRPWLRPGATALGVRAELPRNRPGTLIKVPIPRHTVDTDAAGLVNSVDVLLPPSTPGVFELATSRMVAIDVRAEPGIAVETVLDVRGASYSTSPDSTYFSFVNSLRSLVWAIAALVLSVGLLSFTVASIDRATSRRSELVSLQLVGVRPAILRRTQWIEIALPLTLGSAAAIACGLLAGVAFLSYGSIVDQTPWRDTLVLSAVAMLGALLAASSTLVAASPPIRPETIRTE
ncbi:MAG TPA: FtsX-like permease family protein [Nocardioidaceae bacterium]|nr:FtsX-like permease family protein [Nocardioidaceae bacterium]